MERIAVIGCSGSGKSTLARALAATTGLPLVHLDQVFWRPGWVKPSREDWLATHARLIAEPRWILDGTHLSSLEARLAACDRAVFLDFSRWICVARVVRRVGGGLGAVRPDSAPGCPERVDLEFLRYIWQFRRKYRPRLIEALARHCPGEQTLRLASPAEVRAFLEDPGAIARLHPDSSDGPDGPANRAGP
ncbi:MAG: adenylate kinase [Pseudomonadota bacterium]